MGYNEFVQGKITMKILSWSRRWHSALPANSARTRQRLSRLLLEQLEDRLVPSTVQFSTASETASQPAATFSIPVSLTGNISSITAGFTLNSAADPGGLAFDASGNLYFTNGSTQVDKVTPAGAITTFATGFDDPSGLAFDSAGNLFVANSGNNTVSEVTPAGAVSTFATGIDSPLALAFDAAGNLYVNSSADVDKVTPAGVVSTFAATGFGPVGLAFDAAGNLYVGQYSAIDMVTPAGLVSTFASGFQGGHSLAIDAAGNL